MGAGATYFGHIVHERTGAVRAGVSIVGDRRTLRDQRLLDEPESGQGVCTSLVRLYDENKIKIQIR